MLSVDWYVEETVLSDDFQGLSKFHEHLILLHEGLGARGREREKKKVPRGMPTGIEKEFFQFVCNMGP